MIVYSSGNWHIAYIFRWSGSVFPKALIWALPSAACAFLIQYFAGINQVSVNVSNVVTTVYSSFTYVLGFLVVFRTQQAYARYWEGVSLIQMTRGQWFNAASSLIAFCSSDPLKKDLVDQFQHLLIRLVSILHCTALQQIADISDEQWTTIDRSGIDIPSMSYLAHKTEKCEIIFLWIQRLIIDNTSNGVLCAAPPILSRVFQDLSLGIVNVNSAKKINEVPFPFPYAQMVTVMLLVFTAATPVALGMYAESSYTAAALTFITTGIYWCINYIAAELEMPFGKDANDLPMLDFQEKMNTGLKTLLEEHAQIAPLFDLTKMRSVTMESPMSWEADGVIPPPTSGTNMGSMDFKIWFDALESRKRPVIPKAALDGSIERLGAVSAATWQAVQSSSLWYGRSQSSRQTDLGGTNILGFQTRQSPHAEALDPTRHAGNHHTTSQDVETPPDLGSAQNLSLIAAVPSSDHSTSQPATEPQTIISPDLDSSQNLCLRAAPCSNDLSTSRPATEPTPRMPDSQALHLAIIDPETDSVSI